MTGEDLKKRREELGLSLTEVSLVTKISLRVLHAIEAMDKTQLPAEIFLRGLVKSYALHLKLDADTVTKGYLALVNPPPPKPVAPVTEESEVTQEEISIPAPIVKSEPVKEATEKNSSMPQAPNKSLWIGLGVVGLILILVLVKVINHNQEQPSVAIEQKSDEKDPAHGLPITPGNQSAPVDSASVVSADVPAPAPMPVPVNPVNNGAEAAAPVETAAASATQSTPPPSTQSATEKPAEKPIEKPVVEKPVVAAVATPAPTPPPTPPPVTTEQAAAKPEEKPVEKPTVPEKKPAVPEKKPAAVASGNKHVILEALDKVNIVIKKGSKQYKVSLQPEEIHSVHYSDNIEVEVSDGGAVNVIQNGHDNGVAGDLGKPKKLNL